jgi:polar amino acid transport system substrate-binding protein
MNKFARFFCVLLISFNAFASNDNAVMIAVRDFPPFEFLDNGVVTGVNHKTISDVLERAGYTPIFIPLPFKRALDLAEKGEIDAIASIKYSPEREQNFIFSKPIMYTQDYFFKNKKLTINPKSLNELKQYNIGTVDKYVYGASFYNTNFPNLHPITSSTPEVDNLEKLRSNRLDLALCPIHICLYWLHKYPKVFADIDYIKSPSVDAIQALYIAFSKKNTTRSQEIVEKFNKELAKYIAEGNLKKNLKLFSIDEKTTDIHQYLSKK